MINTHGYCMPIDKNPLDRKPLDIDAFHREQIRMVTQKIDDMSGKLQYCMKQISLMRDTIDWLVICERINKGNMSAAPNSIERMIEQSLERAGVMNK